MCDVLPLRLCFGDLVTVTTLWTCLGVSARHISDYQRGRLDHPHMEFADATCVLSVPMVLKGEGHFAPTWMAGHHWFTFHRFGQ